ncbi:MULTISPECIES: WXG100 family type VII secretion target [Anaerolinea]|nr:MULTISPECIES: WXG100 family type VII secretion target [Anaerolinea]
MTTLHMEVETARSTASNMANTYQQLIGLVQSMNSSVNNLQSAWMGNSATEFFGLYDQWRSSMNTILENLNTMTTKLQTEITEWEQMASNLS